MNGSKLIKIGKLISKICFLAFTFIFALMLTAYYITGENAATISKELGQSTTRKEKLGNAIPIDFFESEYTDIASLKEAGATLAERIEAEGAVLLKNENGALPLNTSTEEKISVFGAACVDPCYSVTGSAKPNANATAPVTVKEGLTEAGFNVNSNLWNFYANHKSYAVSYNSIKDAPWSSVNGDSSVSATFAEFGNAAIVVIKRTGGENGDLALTETDGENGNYLALSANEKSIFNGIAALKGDTFKKTIVLINSPNPVEAEFINDPELKIDAALWIGAVGQSGFNAVGKILSGEVNPSGRLPDTYWNKHSYNPATVNFGVMRYANSSDYAQLPTGSGASYTSLQYTSYVAYEEGIYVGYRYAETRYYDTVIGRDNAGNFDYDKAVAYPFGHGLSYTSFEYSNFDVKYDKKTDTYTAEVFVSNTGDKDGRTAVQLYLSKPYTDYDILHGVEKSAVELVGFAKTRTLLAKSGSKVDGQRLTITVDGSALASYDAYEAKAYIVDKGDYVFTLADDSHKATDNVLAARNVEGANGNKSFTKAFNKEFDSKTYFKGITNEFDYVDPDSYANASSQNDYIRMTRSDWEGTVPSSNAVLYLTPQMADDILAQDKSNVQSDDGKNPTMTGNPSLMLVTLRADADGKLIDYNDEIWDEFLDQLTFEQMAELLVSGMRRTGGLPDVGKPETIDHNGPVGITQAYSYGESGLATKLADPDSGEYPTYFPCPGIVAATFDNELAQDFGTAIGEDALWAGYSGLYGVGINIHRTAYDGRAGEYYSEDPVLGGLQAAFMTVGLQSKGCNAYIKHVAAYEQQSNRVGLSVWCNEQALREIYLAPFKIAVQKGGAMNAMIAYSRLGYVLAPASKGLCTSFLKTECGLKGLIVTDMWKGRYKDEQLVNCLIAGCDIPDGDLSASIYAPYKNGYSKVVWQMREATKRVMYSVVHSNAMNGYTSDTVIYRITPPWQIAVIAVTATFGVLFGLSVLAVAATEIIPVILKRRVK